MYGFACDETPELMPTTIALAHRLSPPPRRSAQERHAAVAAPDGKAQVTVEYHYGRPVRVDTIVISTQHAPEVEQEEITIALREHVVTPVVRPTCWTRRRAT